MSESGHSRRFGDVRVTSAFPPIATKERTPRDVSNVPTADISADSNLNQAVMSAVLLPKIPNRINDSSPFSCALVRIRSLLTDIERLARKNLELEDDRRFQCNVKGRSQALGRLSIMCSGTDHIAASLPHTGLLRGPRTVAHDPATSHFRCG